MSFNGNLILQSFNGNLIFYRSVVIG
jgi:hypothetical protein